jgi:drug/metabolite transporter (DMT)-like permease
VSPRAWIAFASVSFLWGIPYLFIRVAVDGGISPTFLAWARVVLGGLLLLAIAHRAGLLGTLRGRWRWVAAYAVIEITIPFPLIAAGEQYVSSSIAAILIAAVPLIVAGLALRFDATERVSGLRLAGLLIGFSGVVALVGIDVAGNADELLGAGAILLAAVGYAAAPMIMQRKLAGLDPRAIMAGSLLVAALVLTPFAALAPPDGDVSTDAWISIVVLGVFCTALAFVLFGTLVLDVGVGRASVITYVAPVFALAGGIVVLGESPGPGALVGLLLILAGSWLSTDGRLPPALTGRLGGRWGLKAPESSSSDAPRSSPGPSGAPPASPSGSGRSASSAR